MKLSLAAFALCVLAACAPATQVLQVDPTGRVAFEIQQNYQPVYRKVLERARACHQAAGTLVEGDLYTDLRSGKISVAVLTLFGFDTPMTVELTSVADQRTNVEVRFTDNATNEWQRSAAAVEKWLKEGSTDCPGRRTSGT